MEDWTDIIGEELENIEEPLPADDWSVLQQKYAAAQKRKKAAAFAWAGGITSVAAAVALVLLLVRPDSPSIIVDQVGGPDDLVAETLPPTEEVVPVDSCVVESPIDTTHFVMASSPVFGMAQSSPMANTPPVQKEVSAPVEVVKSAVDDVLVAENHTEEIPSENTEEVFDVIRDTTSLKDKLLADAAGVAEHSSVSTSTADKKDSQTVPQVTDDGHVQPTGTFGYEDFPEELPKRSIRLISVGLSGSVSDSPVFGMKDFDHFEPMLPEDGSGNLDDPGYSDGFPEYPEPPTDSLEVNLPQASKTIMRSKTGYTDSYNHEIPVSVGVSARIHLTDEVSVNTGLNYTRYTSTRVRRYDAASAKQKDKQNVHYLGIPVRLDWMAVNRKHFGFYMGAGFQMDKCVYASVAGEKLHEKQVLFGLNGAMGIQVNIVPLVGLYFEPELSYALNEGTIQTFRYDNPCVLTVRGGLRFNF